MKQTANIPDDPSIWRMKSLVNHIKKLEKIIDRQNTSIVLYRKILREIVDTSTNPLMENGDI